MAIECSCPQCQTQFVAPDHYAGRTAVCPRCGVATAVPGAVRQHVLLTPQGEQPSPGPAGPSVTPVQAAPVYAVPVYPAQLYPAQGYPAAQYPAQQFPAQQYPAQAYPAQPYVGQPYPTQAYPAQPQPGQQMQAGQQLQPGQPGSGQPVDLLAAMAGTAPALSILDGFSGDPGQAAWAGAVSPTVAETAQKPSGTDKNLTGARGNVRLSARAAMAVFSAGCVALFAMIVLALPRFGFVLSIALALVGGAVIFAGLVWNNYVAMRESMGTAMWSMLCPPYTIYFLLTRWDKTRKAFWVIAIGVGLTTGGLVSMWHTKNLIAERTGKKPGSGARAAKTEPSRPAGSLGGVTAPSSATVSKPAATPESGTSTPAAATATAPPATEAPAPKPAKKPGRDPEDIVPATDLVTPPGASPQGNPPSK